MFVEGIDVVLALLPVPAVVVIFVEMYVSWLLAVIVEPGDLVSDSCSSARLVGTPVAPPTFVVVFSFWSAVVELFNCVANVAEFSTNADSLSSVVSNSVVESGDDLLIVVSSVFDTVSDVAVVEIKGVNVVVSSDVGEILGSSVVELHMW